MITPFAAAKAYAATQGAGVSAGASIGSSSGPGFGDMVKSAMEDVAKSSKHAEHQMVAQMQGKAQLIDVVTAVSSAEQSLNTVMAIRDQVIGAYQEIMRMPI